MPSPFEIRRPPPPLTVVGASAAVPASAQRDIGVEQRERALRPGEEHDRLALQHPIVIDDCHFATKAVETAYFHIAAGIRNRDTACCFVATPRSGKTWAIEVLRNGLAQVYPNLFMLRVNGRGMHSDLTERGYYGELLNGVDLPLNGTAQDRRTRYMEHIVTRCAELESPVAVLFVDEAQSWDEAEFTWIRDIANDLLHKSIRLILVLFAQSMIEIRRTKFANHSRNDLIGRYLRNPMVLPGLQSADDLEVVLHCCDDPTLHEYPDYSGIAYSEFFMPRAYASGWRLSQETPLFWSAVLNELHITSKKKVNVGMAWIMSGIREFFLACAQMDSPGFRGSAEIWEQPVRSGHFSSLA
jgi:hypothetical protein